LMSPPNDLAIKGSAHCTMNIESKRLRREPDEVIAQHSRSRSCSDCLARQEGPFTMQKHKVDLTHMTIWIGH